MTIHASARNWHKRNVRAADELPVALEVASSPTSQHYEAYVQLRVSSDQKGKLQINMTPEQARELCDILARMCSLREAEASSGPACQGQVG